MHLGNISWFWGVEYVQDSHKITLNIHLIYISVYGNRSSHQFSTLKTSQVQRGWNWTVRPKIRKRTVNFKTIFDHWHLPVAVNFGELTFWIDWIISSKVESLDPKLEVIVINMNIQAQSNFNRASTLTKDRPLYTWTLERLWKLLHSPDLDEINF